MSKAELLTAAGYVSTTDMTVGLVSPSVTVIITTMLVSNGTRNVIAVTLS